MYDTIPCTLARVLQQLEADQVLPDKKRRDLVSSINRVATYLKRPPEDLPASPRQLRELMNRIHPAQIGITAKSWSTVKSSLSEALRATGHMPAMVRRRPLSPAWKDFLAAARTEDQVKKISRFVTFCGHRRIEPQQVTDETMAEFREYVDSRSLTKDPVKLCSETSLRLNSIMGEQTTPFVRLRASLKPRYVCRPLSTYPATLQADLQSYIDRLSHKDIFAEGGPDKALRPNSLRSIEALVRQFLNALTDAGLDPECFTSLEAVVTVENIRLAAQTIRARLATRQIPLTIYHMMAVLLAVARHHLRLPESEVEKIKGLKNKVKPTETGMTLKNRERLGQFTDFQNVVRLVALPQTLVDVALARPEKKTAALRVMYGAAICILLSCPMRMQNLADLDLERHVFPSGSGAGLRYTLRIDADEVKNNNHIEVTLNAKNSRLLHQYIMQYRHHLAPLGSTALFPRKGSIGSRSASNLAQCLTREIFRETGLTMNPHLFRHFAAYLYLREKPGDFETVRRLLRHKKLATTMTYYAELSNQWAHEHYDNVVLKKWGGSDA